MKDDESFKGTVVTGVMGHDIHVIGIRVVEHALRSAGFHIVALGTQVHPDEFVAAAIEAKADAIFVSSLDGHARLWVSGFRDKCIEAGLTDVLLYLGGQLVIGEEKWEDTLKIFKEMGFDRVYPQRVQLKQVVADLEADLGRVHSD